MEQTLSTGQNCDRDGLKKDRDGIERYERDGLNCDRDGTFGAKHA